MPFRHARLFSLKLKSCFHAKAWSLSYSGAAVRPAAGAVGGGPQSAYNRNVGGAQPAYGANGIGGINGKDAATQQVFGGVLKGSM